MTSFSRLAWQNAIIKAPAPISSGKRSGEMQVLAYIEIVPLMPASSDIINRVELQTPTKLLVTYFETNQQITFEEGFLLAVEGTDYPIKALSMWAYSFGENTTYELVVEDLRNR